MWEEHQRPRQRPGRRRCFFRAATAMPTLVAHSSRRFVAGGSGRSREWRRFERGDSRRQARAPGRKVLGSTGLDLSEHRGAADPDRCQWCRVRSCRSVERAGRVYALHGATGKALWNSDKAITSPLSGRSFWVGSGSRVRWNA